MSDDKNALKRLLAEGEEKFQDSVNELLSNPRFAEAMGRAVQGAVSAKSKVDRNMRVAFNLAGIPTRADYDDLVMRIAKLGDALVKLETRLDEIVVRLERVGRQATPRSAK